jgi:hypothetical protein
VREVQFNKLAKAESVTVAKGQRGDAGAVFDLAPKSRLGVGPVSSKRWGEGVRKNGEDKQPNFVTLGFNSARRLLQVSTDGLRFLSPAVLTCRSLRQTLGSVRADWRGEWQR